MKRSDWVGGGKTTIVRDEPNICTVPIGIGLHDHTEEIQIETSHELNNSARKDHKRNGEVLADIMMETIRKWKESQPYTHQDFGIRTSQLFYSPIPGRGTYTWLLYVSGHWISKDDYNVLKSHGKKLTTMSAYLYNVIEKDSATSMLTRMV